MYENIYDYRCQWLLWILHWGKGFCSEDMRVTPILHPTRNGCFNDCKALERKEFVDVLCFKTPLYSSSRSMMGQWCHSKWLVWWWWWDGFALFWFYWIHLFDPPGNIKRWAISPFPGAKLELMYDLVGNSTSEMTVKGKPQASGVKTRCIQSHRLE